MISLRTCLRSISGLVTGLCTKVERRRSDLCEHFGGASSLFSVRMSHSTREISKYFSDPNTYKIFTSLSQSDNHLCCFLAAKYNPRGLVVDDAQLLQDRQCHHLTIYRGFSLSYNTWLTKVQIHAYDGRLQLVTGMRHMLPAIRPFTVTFHISAVS